MTDKLGDKLSLKLSRNEPAVYGDAEDQVNTVITTTPLHVYYMYYTIHIIYNYLVKEKKYQIKILLTCRSF